MHGDYSWGMGWMMVWWWAFWILLVAGIVWFLAKQVSGRATGQEDTPGTVPEHRHARGGISRDEHEQRVTDLGK